MAYYINDECIACGACLDECPNDAIIEGEEKYSIDPEKCQDAEEHILKGIMLCIHPAVQFNLGHG